MRLLYLVMGETNGWEWPVACYAGKKRAEKHRARAQAACKRLWDEYREMPAVAKAMVRNPYDKEHCCAGMYAVEYRVEKVPWCDEHEWLDAQKYESDIEHALDAIVGPEGRESQ
jgi:hypothetical protein